MCVLNVFAWKRADARAQRRTREEVVPRRMDTGRQREGIGRLRNVLEGTLCAGYKRKETKYDELMTPYLQSTRVIVCVFYYIVLF